MSDLKIFRDFNEVVPEFFSEPGIIIGNLK